MGICKNCNRQYEDNFTYCPHCGKEKSMKETRTTFWLCLYEGINDAVKQRSDYADPESANDLTRMMVYAIDSLTNKEEDYILIIEWLAEKQLFSLYNLYSFNKYLLSISQLDMLLDWCGGGVLTFAARQDKTWEKGRVALVGCEPNMNEDMRKQILTSASPPAGRSLRLVFLGDELVEINLHKELDESKKKQIINEVIGYKITRIQTSIRDKYFGREIPNNFGSYAGQGWTQERLVTMIKLLYFYGQNIEIIDSSNGKEILF